MIVFGVLDERDRRQLAAAIDMVARRLRTDGMQPTPTIRQLRELLAAADTNRPQPTMLHEHGEYADTEPMLLDLDECAHRLRVSRRSVERAVATNELHTVTIGRARRVRPDDLADFIAAMPATSPAGRACLTATPTVTRPARTPTARKAQP